MSISEWNGVRPAALPGPEQSDGECSETQRRGGPGNAGTAGAPHPNPEVVAKAQRRTFTAGYKKRILVAADAAAAQPGAIGALLRREGLYSSLLADRRKERAAGITQALSPHPRGPKSQQSPLAAENAELLRENRQLTERLRQAEIIIAVQKLATLLGLPLRTPTDEELR